MAASFDEILISRNDPVSLSADDDIQLSLKREDLLHPEYGGNKFRKLKYNLLKAKESGHDRILTFGGAWSNHIFATAAMCRDYGMKSLGIIRGEEPNNYSDTLQFAKSCGMVLHFISREEYREKEEDFFKAWLHDEFGSFYLVPEGGSNYLGVQGCTEILSAEDRKDFDLITCACGTGATLAGLILSSHPDQKVLGFPVMKGGEYLIDEIRKHVLWSAGDQALTDMMMKRVKLITEYHLGGFAKTPDELIEFMRTFHQKNNIKLDPLYTGKMMFGLKDMMEREIILPGTRILAIHTGGMQGVKGIERRIGVELY